MRKLLSRWIARDSERGAVMFLVVGTIMVVLLVGAVAVDLSAVANRGQNLQNAADSAALAGVKVYRDSGGDKTLAEETVIDLLKQNGINLTPVISYPDPTDNTQLTVTLTDTDSNLLLGDVVGVVDKIERVSTAEFAKCSSGCSQEVTIAKPFSSVEAAGEGDGYKPIPVGQKLYALNHNNTDGPIVCVDINTQQPCWWDPIARVHTRDAYHPLAGGGYNPEMPHAAVVGDHIFWTTSDAGGSSMFCWDTGDDTPCEGSFELNDNRRSSGVDNSNRKDRNRGGGTVVVDVCLSDTVICEQIYAFTDDHRVHCFNPATGVSCPSYVGGGLPTGLGAAGFPSNELDYSNSGSSIDRIVDPTTGFIYSTLHIRTQVATGPLPTDVCVDGLSDPRGYRVVIRNERTGDFIYDDQVNDLEVEDDPTSTAAHWFVRQELWDDTVTLKNVNSGRVLDSDGHNTDPDTSSSIGDDDNWRLEWHGTYTTIESADDGADTDSFLHDPEYDDGSDDGDDLRQRGGDSSTTAHWKFFPYQCYDNTAPIPAAAPGSYQAGTWVHCWDTINLAPCADFTPSAIHTNGDRFSGRLFFYNAERPTGASPIVRTGVCSSGFNGPINRANFEVNCVDMFGAYSHTMSSSLESWATDPVNGIASTVYEDNAAWGDPHWNDSQNRLFYPSQHGDSEIFCWDFDTTSACGSRVGYLTALGTIEDYGFFSIGDCVFGLGHNAIFWAFDARDIDENCTGSRTQDTIYACPCDGDDKWGTVTFDVDLTKYNEFYVQIYDSNGVRRVPSDLNKIEGWSLHRDGITLDLNHLPVLPTIDGQPDFLTLVVDVDSDVDPQTIGDQTFTVEVSRLPHLID